MSVTVKTACFRCGRDHELSLTVYYPDGSTEPSDVETAWVCGTCRPTHERCLDMARKKRTP